MTTKPLFIKVDVIDGVFLDSGGLPENKFETIVIDATKIKLMRKGPHGGALVEITGDSNRSHCFVESTMEFCERLNREHGVANPFSEKPKTDIDQGPLNAVSVAELRRFIAPLNGTSPIYHVVEGKSSKELRMSMVACGVGRDDERVVFSFANPQSAHKG